MDFKEFILIPEARYGPVPGAFGKPKGNRQSNRFQGINDRVAYGKSIEALVIQALIDNCGWNITPATPGQDKHQKIDGWVKFGDGAPLALQVKYRDTGDDILLEVVKVWHEEENLRQPGRDMVGKAEIYACLNSSGTVIYARLASEAKEKAQKLLDEFLQRMTDSQHPVKSHRNGDGEIKLVNDPSTRQLKINAYLNPQAFQKKSDCTLKAPIW